MGCIGVLIMTMFDLHNFKNMLLLKVKRIILTTRIYCSVSNLETRGVIFLFHNMHCLPSWNFKKPRRVQIKCWQDIFNFKNFNKHTSPK